MIQFSPEKLRQHRTRVGLTQENAARAVGVGTTCYYSYEHGATVPNARGLARMTETFECRLDDLFDA